MQKRILHILSDDKFSDYAIEQFENLDVPSDFVLMATSVHEGLVKHRDKTLMYKNGDKETLFIILSKLSSYDAVIFHGLFWWYDTEFLKRIPKTTKVAWVNWGGEIYGRGDVYYNFLSLRSRLLRSLHNFGKHIKSWNQEIYVHHYEVPVELFRRIDYCLTDEREEYEYARDYLQAPNMKHLFYNYYTLEDTVGGLMDKRCCGNNIFLGNSAALEGNYWDVMPKVARLKQKGQKVIMPLSYGSQWVSNWVQKLGKALFRSDFMPLINFMPLDEYNQLVCNCSTMIMPHYAPRAQGNIITGLWLGMRVYLSEKCMTYRYFKRIGCLVYSIEHDLKSRNPRLFEPMTEQQMMHNRAVLQKYYSRESMNEAVHKIVETLVG